ncbi:MAG: DUF2807 domain-containing protein [Alphaproteobacteria bacterium]
MIITKTSRVVLPVVALLLLGLASPPPTAQQPFNGIDLKVSQEISGTRLLIERFAGTLTINTVDSYDKLTLTATGKEDELKKLEVIGNEEGEVEVGCNGKISNSTLALTITMPKQMPLSVHINSGKAVLADHAGPVKLVIDGSGIITAGTLGGELESRINGNGDIAIANIDSTTRTTTLSPLKLSIHGSGSIAIKELNHEDIKATIDGAGTIILGGTVRDGDCTINGTGRIEIAKVAGVLNQSINGSGVVIVGK